MADETLEFEADEFEPELDEEDDSALNAGIMSVLSAQREEAEAAAEEETSEYAFDAEDEPEEMEALADEEELSEPLPVAEAVEPEPLAEQVAPERTDEERRVALLRRFAAMEAKVQEPEYDDEEEQASAPMDNGWTGAIPRPVRAPAPLETAEAPQTARLRRAVPEQPKVAEPVAEASPVDVPAPAAGRASRRAGRVKTRLLGFSTNETQAADPFAESPAPRSTQAEFPVGWLIIVNGPGRGTCFTLQNGVAQIGRGEDQAVRLDFGDNSISRANHAAVAYDAESRKFYLGHGGKANLVRLNNRPVLSTEELDTGNLIRIGETTLRFVALCGKDFDWTASQEDKPRHVSFG
ncbi:FHA domain-containing protein [Sulfitobacter sp. BDSS02]|nr:FHA domain-containing protein [Sulfitobacter sp. BDSS02]MBR9850023.1 FHA domain-containing protein [Paracoccaceae bacterium]